MYAGTRRNYAERAHVRSRKTVMCARSKPVSDESSGSYQMHKLSHRRAHLFVHSNLRFERESSRVSAAHGFECSEQRVGWTNRVQRRKQQVRVTRSSSSRRR